MKRLGIIMGLWLLCAAGLAENFQILPKSARPWPGDASDSETSELKKQK